MDIGGDCKWEESARKHLRGFSGKTPPIMGYQSAVVSIGRGLPMLVKFRVVEEATQPILLGNDALGRVWTEDEDSHRN